MKAQEPTTAGSALRDRRVAAGASQTAVGRAMGVSRARVVAIEGQAVVGAPSAQRYYDALVEAVIEDVQKRLVAVAAPAEASAFDFVASPLGRGLARLSVQIAERQARGEP